MLSRPMVKNNRHSSDNNQTQRRLFQPVAAPKAKTDDIQAQIDRINELSKTARATWLSLLGYLAFVGVTLLGVEDVDFFVASRRTDLPLINVAIPTREFFIFAPILGTAIFAYLHFHLLKLWHALKQPEAEVNGDPLSDHLTPWLITDMGLAYRFDKSVRPLGLQVLSLIVTFLLVFVAGPAVIGGFWWRYWSAHEPVNTLIIGVAFVLSVYIALASLNAVSIKLVAKNIFVRIGFNIGQFIVLLVLVSFVGLMKTAGLEKVAGKDPPEYTFAGYKDTFAGFKASQWMVDLAIPEETEDGFPILDDNGRPIRPELALAQADISEVELIPKPDNWRPYDDHKRRFRREWCAGEGLKPEVCGPLLRAGDEPPPHQIKARQIWAEEFGVSQGERVAFFADINRRFNEAWKIEREATIEALPNLNLQGKDLRNAFAFLSFLPGADLRKARLEGADLSFARLEGADLSDARLERADLSDARLERADLSDARLERADLSGARLERADLSGARLEGADLRLARLEGANLFGARLERADLSRARLEGAVLSDARLEGADLRGARLEGANLREARLEGANLREARLEGADLSRARLEGANLREARLEGADLRGARLERADLIGARLERADLSDARLEGANLFGARLEGADLIGARLQSVKWARATIRYSLAHFTDLRDARGLTQAMLDNVIGDGDTLLPDTPAPDTGRLFYVWSCWQAGNVPPSLDQMLKRNAIFESVEDLRNQWVCSDTNPRVKTGTPTALDPN